MIVFYVFCGIGVAAVGLAVTDMLGKGKKRWDVDRRAINIGESSSTWQIGEYFPPPDDGRPHK